ncbi:MAG: NADH-quinone oxidoreductase subunit J [Cyclobacteriaceae bacterium]
MTAHTVIFYFLETLAAVSAIGILFTRNVFYGALMLITCLLAIAGIFIFLNAEFIAVTQILIYAGGIVVLIIFGVMLTSKISGKPLVVKNQNWLSGIAAGLFFFGLLLKLFSEATFATTNQTVTSQYTFINHIGILLMTDYMFAFEVAGILLLIALIGAAVVASAFQSTKKEL